MRHKARRKNFKSPGFCPSGSRNVGERESKAHGVRRRDHTGAPSPSSTGSGIPGVHRVSDGIPPILPPEPPNISCPVLTQALITPETPVKPGSGQPLLSRMFAKSQTRWLEAPEVQVDLLGLPGGSAVMRIPPPTSPPRQLRHFPRLPQGQEDAFKAGWMRDGQTISLPSPTLKPRLRSHGKSPA